jgi:hypothetical protein
MNVLADSLIGGFDTGRLVIFYVVLGTLLLGLLVGAATFLAWLVVRLRSRARLPAIVTARILTFPEDAVGRHHVALVMAEGTIIEEVVVARGDEVVRIGRRKMYALDPSQVLDVLDRSVVPPPPVA